MINVLPPEAKSQLKYSQLNSRLLRYLMLGLGAGALLISLLFASLIYGDKQIESYQSTLDMRQAQRKDYQEIEDDVKTLKSNLSLINSLLNEKTTYSALLEDLAAALPSNSFITQMQLTGDEGKPMEIIVNTDSFNRAAEVRNGLISSDRIKSADIQTVTRSKESSDFIVVLVLAFEKGAAR